METVDLVVLTRDDKPLDQRVEDAIGGQQCAVVRRHRVIGRSRPQDRCRRETIARARNEAKTLGTSPWLMFLDDDVVLPCDGISRLLQSLKDRSAFGAMAIDYLGESTTAAGHVGMGATLFRREVLDRFEFRWEFDLCECSCCCIDLRAQGMGIGYLENCCAEHIDIEASAWHGEELDPKGGGQDLEGEPTVLAAFDRYDVSRFRSLFMRSLRASGNHGPVIALTYGLYPSERRTLERLPNLELLAFDKDPQSHPAWRRYADFQCALRGLPAATPVAYWDAGDIVFQNRLDEIWSTVRRNPCKLLLTRELLGHGENEAVYEWFDEMTNAEHREKVRSALGSAPVFNSGFLASTASHLTATLKDLDHIMKSMMDGPKWGKDQLALNYYHATQADACQEIDNAWNFTLCTRDPNELVVGDDGRAERSQGKPVHVIHGNDSTLKRMPGYDRLLQYLSSQQALN